MRRWKFERWGLGREIPPPGKHSCGFNRNVLALRVERNGRIQHADVSQSTRNISAWKHSQHRSVSQKTLKALKTYFLNNQLLEERWVPTWKHHFLPKFEQFRLFHTRDFLYFFFSSLVFSQKKVTSHTSVNQSGFSNIWIRICPTHNSLFWFTLIAPFFYGRSSEKAFKTQCTLPAQHHTADRHS